MGSHKHQVLSSTWQLCRGLYSWRCCCPAVLPGQSVPSCPACCVPGPPGLMSRTSAQPGSPSLHHCSRFFLPSCKMSHLFFSCVPLCSSLKTCWASAPGGLHQGIDRDAKDRVSRCPCGVLVIGLQAEYIPLKPAECAHPVSPPPTLSWPNSEQYWEILGEAVGSLAIAFRKESI